MTSRKPLGRFWLLVALALVGAALVFAPPYIMAQYRAAMELGETWGYAYLALVGVGAVIFLGSTGTIAWQLWSAGRQKQLAREQAARNPSELSTAEQQSEIKTNVATIETLRRDSELDAAARDDLGRLVERLEAKEQTARLEIVAFGTISSGKSSLLNALAGNDVFQTDARGGTTTRRSEIAWRGAEKVVLVDTPGLAEVAGEEHVAVAAEAARDADVVLVVVDGALRESEHRLLRELAQMEKRVLVCLNKEDLLSDDDRRLLLGQIADQVRTLVAREHVLAVRAQSVTRTRRRVLATGGEVEEPVELPADLGELPLVLLGIVQEEGPQLVLANLLLQSRGLVEAAHERVVQAIDRRAWKIVEAYMWGAGSAAALSPFPVVDLAAGCAISAKMVVDLAAVYRQPLDFESAVKLLGQLGKNLVSILGAHAITPAIAAGLASLIKAVPGIGTLAGGLVQGVVQALVTRWIGAVFIDYFRNEMKEPSGGLAALARRKWEQLTTADEIRSLVAAARERLRGGPA